MTNRWVRAMVLGLCAALAGCVAEAPESDRADESEGLASAEEGAPEKTPQEEKPKRCALDSECGYNSLCMECECYQCPSHMWCYPLDLPQESCPPAND